MTEGRAAVERPLLGIDDPMPQIQGLWDAIQDSAEAEFYSAADWHRVRLELMYGDEVIRELKYGFTVPTKDGVQVCKKVNAQAWVAFQNALTELLVSPAAKRRAGIELKPKTSDPDEDAAVVQLAEYQASLGA